MVSIAPLTTVDISTAPVPTATKDVMVDAAHVPIVEIIPCANVDFRITFRAVNAATVTYTGAGMSASKPNRGDMKSSSPLNASAAPEITGINADPIANCTP